MKPSRRRAATRPWIAAAGAVGAAIVLVACTASPAPESTASSPSSSSAAPAPSAIPSATPATPSPSPSFSGSAAEERFVGTVQQLTPTLASLPPATVLALGRQICQGFRSGQDAGRVAVALSESTQAPGLTQTDVAFLLGAGVATLCPQYRDRLDDDG